MSDGYHVGDVWIIDFTLTNATGTLVNNTSKLTVAITSPSGSTGAATASLVAGSTGRYKAPYGPLGTTGLWQARIRSTGTYVGQQPTGIQVMP